MFLTTKYGVIIYMKFPDISVVRLGYKIGIAGLVLFFLQACTGAGSGDDGGSSGGGAGGGTSDRAACLADDADYVNTFISSLTTRQTAQGGQLYDKWWAALGVANGPIMDHPVWSDQSTNTRSGSDTWRCKECHGWDYKGAAGAYNSGNSHFTGFPGIFAASSKDPVEVFCDIKAGTASNPDHQFNVDNTEGQLTDVQILYLAKFITAPSNDGGMADSDTYITSGTSTAIGDSVAGETVFGTTLGNAGCASASCHDVDGTLNAGIHTIGELATGNPWEVLHKIRYGHPNSPMPAFVSIPQLTTVQMQNVLAYSQTLPGGGGGGGTPTPSDADKMMLGGLLYDKWTSELGITPPGDNPLWASQNTNARTGTTTWRCKECHGWDYKGVDGVYGSGSHYTGFPGVYDVAIDAGTTEADVFDIIKDGFFNPFDGTRMHDFGEYLSDAQVEALAYFIKSGGVIDTDQYILSTLGWAQGDPTNGTNQYSFAGFGVANGNCELCHGNDGQLINFGTVAIPLYLGELSRDNPWEVLHKARFGQPNSNMPAMVQSGLTLDDAVDVLTHVQSLP